MKAENSCLELGLPVERFHQSCSDVLPDTWTGQDVAVGCPDDHHLLWGVPVAPRGPPLHPWLPLQYPATITRRLLCAM